MQKTTIRNIVVLVVVLVILAVIVLFATQARTDTSIDTKPEGVATDFSIHANIVDGEELLKKLGSLDSFNYLARDLHLFARSFYEAYRVDASRVVGFRVTSPVIVNDKSVEFSGHYGSSRNEIIVIVKKLNNGMVSTSITDREAGSNMDNDLPSNSRLSKFLGDLPIHDEQYSINFISPTEIEVSIYSVDPGAYDKAYNVIEESIGKEEIDKITIGVSLPSLFAD